MRRYLAAYPIRTFLLLVFILSWPLLIYGFGWFGSRETILPRYLLACTGMSMVALSAFITRAFVERKGFRDAGWYLGDFICYIIVLIFCALLWVSPSVVALLFGNLARNPSISRDEMIVVILSLGGLSLLAGFSEEFGWRGYLIPRMLTDRRRSREVLVLIGLVWGVWHCAVPIGPFLRAFLNGANGWIAQIGPTILQCLQAVAASVALSFIFGAVWLKSRSIFLSSFFHGYYIGIRESAGMLFSYPVEFRLITLVFALIAWTVAYRWLKAFERKLDIDGRTR